MMMIIESEFATQFANHLSTFVMIIKKDQQIN